MSKPFNTTLFPLLVLFFAISAVIGLSIYLDANRPETSAEYADEDLSLKAGNLRGYSLGLEGLLADWYWMRSLQYVGSKVVGAKDPRINVDDLRSLDPRLLYPLLDSATTLDPNFDVAYSYGAIVLPAIDPKQAIAIAEKGIANNPQNWRNFQHLGYIYWKLGEYGKAAEVYNRGAQVAGAPQFLGLMSAKMNHEGGSRETSREIYSQMLAGASDENSKSLIKLRLAELDSADQREIVQNVLNSSKAASGTCPESFQKIRPQLIAASEKQKTELSVNSNSQLVDPTGAPYLLNQKNCTITLDPEKTKLPR